MFACFCFLKNVILTVIQRNRASLLLHPFNKGIFFAIDLYKDVNYRVYAMIDDERLLPDR
jgi:hypothetical protein